MFLIILSTSLTMIFGYIHWWLSLKTLYSFQIGFCFNLSDFLALTFCLLNWAFIIYSRCLSCKLLLVFIFNKFSKRFSALRPGYTVHFLHVYCKKFFIGNVFNPWLITAPLATMGASFLIIEPHIMPDFSFFPDWKTKWKLHEF